MKGEEKQVKTAMENLGPELQRAKGTTYSEMMKKLTGGSYSLHDFLKLDDSKIENLYAHAYRLYNTGKYKESSQLFRYLMMVNPGEPRYVFGLAACCHLLKDYKAAAEIYLICSILDEKSPIPAFHASDCYLQMNDKISALVSLNIAIDKASSKSEYKILKDRALLTADTIKKELNLNEEATIDK